ncbi:hypothetical protein LV78_003018 [Actinosynnema pretiosum]|nr:hypothetical protein [Actinosynnema pretiosum]
MRATRRTRTTCDRQTQAAQQTHRTRQRPRTRGLNRFAGCGASAASPRSPNPASLFSVWPGAARARSSRCRRTARQTARVIRRLDECACLKGGHTEKRDPAHRRGKPHHPRKRHRPAEPVPLFFGGLPRRRGELFSSSPSSARPHQLLTLNPKPQVHNTGVKSCGDGSSAGCGARSSQRRRLGRPLPRRDPLGPGRVPPGLPTPRRLPRTAGRLSARLVPNRPRLNAHHHPTPPGQRRPGPALAVPHRTARTNRLEARPPHRRPPPPPPRGQRPSAVGQRRSNLPALGPQLTRPGHLDGRSLQRRPVAPSRRAGHRGVRPRRSRVPPQNPPATSPAECSTHWGSATPAQPHPPPPPSPRWTASSGPAGTTRTSTSPHTHPHTPKGAPPPAPRPPTRPAASLPPSAPPRAA